MHNGDAQGLFMGPLQPLMDDPEVTEIMVNGYQLVFIERHGKKSQADVRFESPQQLRYVVERLLQTSASKRLDESSPYVDVSLPGGHRANMIIPPLVLDGPHLTIRKYSRPVARIEDFIERDAFDKRMAQLLYGALRARLNIMFSGATGVGKTTLLEVLSNYIDPQERIVVIEDTMELHFRQANVVRLLTRPPNLEGKGEVTSGQLFKNSLRMTPGRIILGEIRGREALDLLQAMNSGHAGSLAVIHASTPEETVIRMENLVALGGVPIAPRVIKRQIAYGLDLIVQLARYPDGARRVTHISEVVGLDADGEVEVKDVFRFKEDGVTRDGVIMGRYVATGHVPTFFDKLTLAGVALSKAIFAEGIPASRAEVVAAGRPR